MPVTQEERARYFAFVQEQVNLLGALELQHDEIIWHYTTGEALISIIESSSIFSTHVSCLNDRTEMHYAERRLRDAFVELQTVSYPQEEADLLARLLTDGERNQDNTPSSSYFVTCLSSRKDDLSQWRAYGGGENGYAIGFLVGGFFNLGDSIVARVNYDENLHRRIAQSTAQATLRFYREGLDARQGDERGAWADVFRQEWFSIIERLSPMVKDPAFSDERECRVIYRLPANPDLAQFVCRQRNSMMSLHYRLTFPRPGDTIFTGLPIAEVLVGPSRHMKTSQLSTGALLRKKGYLHQPVDISIIPFQTT